METTEKNFETKTLPDNTIEIVKYTGKSKNVVIPATINGVKVAVIGAGAFANNNLTNTEIIQQ